MKKHFYYTGESHNGATYKEEYTRASRWLKINYTTAENSRPYVRHNNKRYYLEDFIRLSAYGYNTEVTAADGETVTLSGSETDVYYKPYFIEIDESGEAARLYTYEGTEIN